MSVPEVLSGADPSKGRHNEESKAAWEKARHSARNVRECILEGMRMLESAGWKTGLTPKEFARWVGKPLHAISGRFGDLAALAAAAARGENGESERGERSPLAAALAMQHARLVALQDVRGLVRQHARELRLGLRERDESAVDPDVAAHERECVDHFVLNHEIVDIAARRIGDGEQPRAQRGNVVGDLGIVDVVLVDAHLAHDAVADGAFLLVRKAGGRGVAQVGKALRERRRCRQSEQ